MSKAGKTVNCLSQRRSDRNADFDSNTDFCAKDIESNSRGEVYTPSRARRRPLNCQRVEGGKKLR
jgi:hypothetical protein